MKLVDVQVDGYNILHNLKLGEKEFSGRVTLITGLNETGKSTLLAFIRAVLFGFGLKGEPDAEPLRGGRPGGQLSFANQAGEIYQVRRSAPPKRGKVTVTGPRGERGDEGLLKEKVLHGVSYRVYKNVFAFGMDELRRLDDLTGDEVSAHIYGAGTGVPAARLTAAAKALQEGMAALFKPGGHRPGINRVLKQLTERESTIKRLQQLPDEYEKLQRQLRELEEQRNKLATTKPRLEQGVRRLEQLRRASPTWAKLQEARLRLESIPPVDKFPAGGLEHLANLTQELAGITAKLQGLELDAGLTENELNLREQALTNLEQDYAQLISLTRRLEQGQARETDLSQSLDKINAELEGNPENLPWWPQLAAGLTFVCLGVVIFKLTLNGTLALAALTAGALVTGIMTWQMYRVRTSQLAQRQSRQREAQELSAALASVRLELAGLAAEERMLQNRIRTAAHHAGLGEAQFPAGLAAARQTLARDAAALSQRAGLELAARRVEQATARLLAAGDASTEAEFRGRAAWHLAGELARDEIKRCRHDLTLLAGSPELLAAMEADLAAGELGEHGSQLTKTRQSPGELDEQLKENAESIGRLKERIKILESGEELAAALQGRELTRANLASLAGEWMTRALCLELLQKARARHELKRQPAVLRCASGYLGSMTGGAYTRVIWDPERLEVERPDGARVNAGSLSRGAAGQLYLAVRLALAREYGETVRLPIILDDVLVDFDPLRLRGTLSVIDQVAREHQVIMLTCHSHIADACRSMLSELSLVNMTPFTKVPKP